MRPKVIGFSSINIDEVYHLPHIVRPGETLSSTGRQQNAGGKGTNASVAAARAGAQVYVVGKIGGDGLWVRDVIARAGANVELVSVMDDTATGRAIIQVDASGENAIFLFPGANHKLTERDAHRAFAQFARGDWLLLTNETTAVGEAIAQAHRLGIQVLWNPAPMQNSLLHSHDMTGLVDVLVVNETELVGLAKQFQGAGVVDSCNEYEALARLIMRELRCRVVVATLGRDGCIGLVRRPTTNSHLIPVGGSSASISIASGSSNDDSDDTCSDDIKVIRMECSPIRIEQVKDTTAAGDVWVGYFVAELARAQGESPESIGAHAALTPAMVRRAMTNATFASGISVTRIGAVPSIPMREEVEAFIRSKRHDGDDDNN
ncbi:putative ribokinase [Coemansia thaxteri]|uniref:Ribokinase n=1 Tax=Coemansia thaxteri TaxID=2663907 RepID=A0A9W8BIJ4_9FUNG|nr:putative ribokinase [Coemansia thaxteri]KAJ2008503.1 putative ribokinase [Coemansia thaxteri]KAJ2467620.1 putative ribokinase [Coemansia sp. RSA 2322]KAJ2487281.1 putative ribokinase [Coemansia sp. RSA 2320]